MKYGHLPKFIIYEFSKFIRKFVIFRIFQRRHSTLKSRIPMRAQMVVPRSAVLTLNQLPYIAG